MKKIVLLVVLLAGISGCFSAESALYGPEDGAKEKIKYCNNAGCLTTTNCLTNGTCPKNQDTDPSNDCKLTCDDDTVAVGSCVSCGSSSPVTGTDGIPVTCGLRNGTFCICKARCPEIVCKCVNGTKQYSIDEQACILNTVKQCKRDDQTYDCSWELIKNCDPTRCIEDSQAKTASCTEIKCTDFLDSKDQVDGEADAVCSARPACNPLPKDQGGDEKGGKCIASGDNYRCICANCGELLLGFDSSSCSTLPGCDPLQKCIPKTTGNGCDCVTPPPTQCEDVKNPTRIEDCPSSCDNGRRSCQFIPASGTQQAKCACLCDGPANNSADCSNKQCVNQNFVGNCTFVTGAVGQTSYCECTPADSCERNVEATGKLCSGYTCYSSGYVKDLTKECVKFSNTNNACICKDKIPTQPRLCEDSTPLNTGTGETCELRATGCTSPATCQPTQNNTPPCDCISATTGTGCTCPGEKPLGAKQCGDCGGKECIYTCIPNTQIPGTCNWFSGIDDTCSIATPQCCAVGTTATCCQAGQCNATTGTCTASAPMGRVAGEDTTDQPCKKTSPPACGGTCEDPDKVCVSKFSKKKNKMICKCRHQDASDDDDSEEESEE